MERPSIRQLECLVAVAETRSFRRAATALGISQPALSAQVQAAEHVLGIQVFERDRRSVLITSAGDDVVNRAREALIAVDAVGDAARRRGEPLVGSLRLGVIPTIAPYWLPALLPEVHRQFPRLELILREDQTHRLLAQLSAGQLELALLAIPVQGDFTTASVAREGFVAAAPRGAKLIKHRGKLTERDLEGETVLLLEDGHCLRDQALEVCKRAGAVESVEVRATSLPTLVQMVAGGLGVTLLPEAAIATLVQKHGPVALAEFAKPVPGRTIGLAWRTSSGRLREFRLLAETMGVEAEVFLTRSREATRKLQDPGGRHRRS
ncbi:MAG TPA: hydrogen peroxide-inducible genes activator [Kofleriaceae bacterium]|jgi:LysR family hydrogen peroxide-inducible transcriptional activator|nr:hydrogen peroxide-inducible genes activator [Kofleriaceae bacterium]